MTTNTIRFRPWQKACLTAFATHSDPDFLAVATPGSGKTVLAASAHHLNAKGMRLVVVTPTTHLKVQWTSVAARFGLHLNSNWTPSEGLWSDFDGIVTTYAHLGGEGVAEAMRREAHGAFVVLDEIHHAADKKTWGDAVFFAFQLSARRLALSGTPFRSDDSAIPYVRYIDGEAQADYVFGYREALADGGVVRPVTFPLIGGNFAWMKDGIERSASFDESLSKAETSARLKTALSMEGEWLPAVLSDAAGQLDEMRRTDPIAGGLVIATDMAHARVAADRLKAISGRDVVLVTSDNPKASALIGAFAESKDPWIVAVRMVSEGVDIPRLRVGVYATSITTELFFRQAVGRIVRWRSELGPDQTAVMYVPDDPRLRRVVMEFEEHRIHVAKTRAEESDELDDFDDAVKEFEKEQGDDEVWESGSLFEVLKAERDGETLHQPTAPTPTFDLGDEMTIELPPISDRLRPLVTSQRDIRTQADELSKRIAALSGHTIAQVNSELNRLARVSSVAQARHPQLVRRLEFAEQWLSRLGA